MTNRAFQTAINTGDSIESEKETVSVSTETKYETSEEELKQLIGKTFKNRFKVETIDSLDQLMVALLCKDLKNDCNVTMRSLRFTQPEILDIFHNQAKKVESLSQTDGSGILRIIDVIPPSLVEERPIQPTLEHLIQNEMSFTLKQTLQILISICKALESAKKEGLTHGRLCPSNIVIYKNDDEFTAKIGGFGYALIQQILFNHGLLPLEAPYLAQSKNDIYSLGAIGYTLLFGELPVVSKSNGINFKNHEDLPIACGTIDDGNLIDSIFSKALNIDGQSYESLEIFSADLRLLLNSIKEVANSKDEESVLRVIPEFARTKEQQQIEDHKTNAEEQEFADKETESDLEEHDFKIELPNSSLFRSIGNNKPSTNSLPKAGDIILDRFVLLECLSKNDYCSVYLGKDLSIDQLVAIKFANNPTPARIAEFQGTSEKLSKLKHDSIPNFIDFQIYEGRPFYVMEYIDAPTLKILLDDIGSMETEKQIASIAIQLCESLNYLHFNGIFHGNITSDNIMLVEKDGEVCLKLCGLYANLSNEEDSKQNIELGESPIENSPDWNSAPPPCKKDIFQTTVLIYQLTTGKLLFENSSEEFIQPASGLLSEENIFGAETLEKLLIKGLNINSPDYFKSIKELEVGLKEWIKETCLDLDLPEEEVYQKRKRTTSEWIATAEVKTLEQMQKEMKQSQVLKANQVKVENTLAMKLTKTIAPSGRRKSPMQTILEVSGIVITSGLVLYSIAYYGINNYDSLQKTFASLSKDLSSSIYKSKSKRKSVKDTIAIFDYKKDPVYKRWAKAKEVGETRRILPDGNLRNKY